MIDQQISAATSWSGYVASPIRPVLIQAEYQKLLIRGAELEGALEQWNSVDKAHILVAEDALATFQIEKTIANGLLQSAIKAGEAERDFTWPAIQKKSLLRWSGSRGS